MATIQLRRGVFSALPASAAVGEPLYSTDTNQLFIGNGTGNPLTEIGATSPPPPPGYTDEQAQDAVGGILGSSSTIVFTYNDAAPSITAEVGNSTIDGTKLMAMSARSVIGRPNNTGGNAAIIAAGNATGHVLVESGGTLGFGQVTSLGIADNAITSTKITNSNVTIAKIENMSARTIIGRAGSTIGAPAEIAATGSTDAVLRESGGSIGFGTIVAGGIASDAITTVKILDANVTTPKIADANVTTAKIADANVTLAKLTSAVANALVPTGTILPYGGSSAPSGYALCDGTAVNRTGGTYDALFAIIGTNFGVGNGSTTFNLPDLRGRTPIGAGTGTGLTARTRGTMYGAETVVMTATNMPSGVMYIATGTGTNAVQSGVSFSNYVASAFVAGSATAMQILNPVQAVNYIIKL